MSAKHVIQISEEIKNKVPRIALGTIICNVANTQYNKDLWDEINAYTTVLKSSISIDQIKQNARIQSTREAYKKCGKDPNRYRPSSEALQRRLLRGFELYQITTLVDLINLVSLKTGFSIGGFDANLVQWPVELGIGKANEPYEGIGKGMLNIEGLPVLRDAKGGIGTPTSDEVRTSIQLSTSSLYMNINAYTGKEDLKETMDWSVDLLKKYTDATDFELFIVE
jgi:DNA/RNA-binding domain of Phe-tRNA-synthetase-like protein